MLKRPSFIVQGPWRLDFDNRWNHHIKKSTKKPLKPQLKLLSFCRSLSPWRGRHLIKYVQPFGAKTHHCCHWSKVTSPDRTIQKSLNRERGLVWSTNILVYLSVLAMRQISTIVILNTSMLLPQSVSENMGETGGMKVSIRKKQRGLPCMC